jgi:hypothetical protein
LATGVNVIKLLTSVIYECKLSKMERKRLATLAPLVNVTQPFSLSLMLLQSKLDCLSLANLSSLFQCLLVWPGAYPRLIYFVPGKDFQPRLIISSKAGAYPSGAPV